MNLQLHKESLHHAYVLEGDKETLIESLFAFLTKELHEKREGNPDLFSRTYDVLGIDDARELVDRHSRKAIGNGKKLFVLVVHGIAWEAQNALLKLFEEPTPDTHFFIITSRSQFLLPTLRSRLQVLSFIDEGDQGAAKNFLKMDIDARLKKLTEILADEEAGKETFRSLLVDIEKELAKDSITYAAVLPELLSLKRNAAGRSASLKMIGEYLAIRLPNV